MITTLQTLKNRIDNRSLLPGEDVVNNFSVYAGLIIVSASLAPMFIEAQNKQENETPNCKRQICMAENDEMQLSSYPFER